MEAMAFPTVPTMEAMAFPTVPTMEAAAPPTVPAVEAMASPTVSTTEAMAPPTVSATEATASASTPTAIPRVPWDSADAEHRDQDDHDHHPLLGFTSTLMPVAHAILLYPYFYDHRPDFLFLPCRQPLPQRVL
jgi:hypothetical protein